MYFMILNFDIDSVYDTFSWILSKLKILLYQIKHVKLQNIPAIETFKIAISRWEKSVFGRYLPF